MRCLPDLGLLWTITHNTSITGSRALMLCSGPNPSQDILSCQVHSFLRHHQSPTSLPTDNSWEKRASQAPRHLSLSSPMALDNTSTSLLKTPVSHQFPGESRASISWSRSVPSSLTLHRQFFTSHLCPSSGGLLSTRPFRGRGMKVEHV